MASEIFRVEPFNNQLEANEMVDYYGLSAKKILCGTLLQWYPSTRSQSAVASENFRVEPPNNQSEEIEMAYYYVLSASCGTVG